MKRGIFLIAALTIAGFLTVTAVSATHTWGNFHWARTSNPFTLKLGDNVSSTWDPYLVTASVDWSVSSVLDTTIVPGSVTNKKLCTPPNGRVEVCNERYGFNGWLGLAGIWVNSASHITKGYVKLNDTYFNTSTYNTPAWRHLVTCQEIGHTFGLSHTDETFNNPNQGTCMDYTNDPDGGAGGASPTDPSNEHPNQHDYDQLVTIYTHLDSTTTVSSSAPTGPGGGNGNGNGSLAAAAGLDEHGLPAWASPANGDVYITELGNGEKRIVHVFWIPAGLPGAR